MQEQVKKLIKEEVKTVLIEETSKDMMRTVRSVKRFFLNQGVQGIEQSHYDKEKDFYFLSSTLNNGDSIQARIRPHGPHMKTTIKISSKTPSRNVEAFNIQLPHLWGEIKEKYNEAIQNSADANKLK